MHVSRRLKALEQTQGPSETFRLIVSSISKSLNLATSTCLRKRSLNGVLSEVVYLDGTAEGLSDEALEEFVATFPIEDC